MPDMTQPPTTRMPPLSQQWHDTEQGVSLIRFPLPARPITMQAQPECIELDLNRTQLVVVDMQNDFCHPQGWFGIQGVDISPMRSPLTTLIPLVDGWRALGYPVLWLNWGIRPDCANLSPTQLHKGRRLPDGIGYGDALPGQDSRAVVAGDWGARNVDELPPREGDLLIHKHRLSGFWDSELDSVLRQRGITTLLFAGINTDRCVFSTLQDAAFLGYDCVLLEDACGTPSPQYVSDAIYFLVRQLHGFVGRATHLLDACAP
ncbi:isochorismatase hydrolase [Alloalcanivorax dieselolei B5]|uniref:Isochorismatase hydrolase n=2 Tax=Alloalcanivorax dieselolei TaxID=285091 RepID=K0CGR8_ALCDB|nr:isochorismatase hydrolase [Alloalcanivorax dieselolei B5]GGJ89649.1 peroxyureidoacrylate/ureidoacrylate amidohydrolase RutB [Alloalcanivorax dieselolei]